MNRDWRFTTGGRKTVLLRTDNWPVVFLSILHDLARHAQHNDWATSPSREVVYAIRGLRIFIEEDEEYSGRAEQFHQPSARHAPRRLAATLLTEVVKAEQLQEGKVDPEEREERLARTARACSKAFEFWEAYWSAYTTKYPQAHAAASLAKSSARSAFTPVARAQQS
ncbi:hypothetical protein Rhopal_002456-T1 [Rhodotorula paludigena]|uniref:Uncharacterized protein n=1 Tax=Rhodotorula paludigena TaxID=86838 RepID=A0AAV5GI25_9BASI|nr:hypothetical protein Rhopal_002456-T1 [Rhodotorula paludigena]